MITAGTTLQDRYLIEEQIGTGGMGRVYLAVDRRFENRVAIKETFFKDENLREAFEREAKLLNGLHHPVLPHVSDYFTEGSEHFIVMEYIAGEDLYAILKREGAFPVEKVLRWSKQMLDALDYLHSQNPPIIHRDIKPQNLKITARDDIILLDFGLAKLSAEDSTGGVSVFGYSRAYSPLEQIQGTGTDARSDIFALAATVFHLLTGKPPVDVLSRAAEIIAGKVDPLQSADKIRPEIPASIAKILRKALSLNPSERFDSAKSAQEALESAMNRNGFIASESYFESPESENYEQQSMKVLDFPALKSFAFDTANSSTRPVTEIKSAHHSFRDSNSQGSNPKENTPTTINLPQTTATGEDPAQRRTNLSWLGIGVLAAVLIGGGVAFWQYAGKSKASTENVSPMVANSAPSKAPETKTPASETFAGVAENNPSKTGEPPAFKAAIVNKKPEENRQPVSDEVSDNENEAAKPKAAASSEKPKETIERPRIVTQPRREQEAPLPDIEEIFTGQTRQERAEQRRRQAQREERRRARRQERRRILEEMDEDLEPLRPRRRRIDW